MAAKTAKKRQWSWNKPKKKSLIYSAARYLLGIAWAKKMIAICTNTQKHKEYNCAVTLVVIDGEF